MRFDCCIVSTCLLAGLVLSSGRLSVAQELKAVCKPKVSERVVVASPKQRLEAGRRAQPPLTDIDNGFAWPDTVLGVIKTQNGYKFFASDGGIHARQDWDGHWVGNDKAGAVVTTEGTLDDPLGSGSPLDVSISPSVPTRVLASGQDWVNPHYGNYVYMGGGSVYQVPEGMKGAGNLLLTYHAELPVDPLYSVLGLAASSDGGKQWRDLGEIIRLNQAYAVGLDGFDIGDARLVLSPDGKYFYLYFPDWNANGTLHTTNAAGISTTTNISVARAPVEAVLDAAFGNHGGAPSRTVPFEKLHETQWGLQPGEGGASTDLIPESKYQGYLDIHYNSAIHRYILITSDDTEFGYAESVDGLSWSVPQYLGTFGPIAAYPTAVGFGADPHVLGKSFYLYFTLLPTDGSGWANGSLQRLTVSCQ
jgi:hypothetical protein